MELLVLQRPSTGPKDATEELLLERFLGTMDLGWHAAVQPDGETEAWLSVPLLTSRVVADNIERFILAALFLTTRHRTRCHRVRIKIDRAID